MRHTPLVCVVVCGISWLFLTAPPPTANAQNLVANGGFEQDDNHDGQPDHWTTSGRREIHQQLTRDAGHTSRFSAKLQCTRFVGGTPDSHVMICQLGQVAVRRGQWYRLRFWTKAKDIAKRVCEVAVSNTSPWQSSGVSGHFMPTRSWRQVEILSQATRDVPAATSRLQIWFGSTGTLWLDDITLEPITLVRKLHPAIATSGVSNPIPNSSFECGPSGWGSYSPNITTWAGNLNRLVGTIDKTTAWHGNASLRVQLNKKSPLVFHWDYYDPAIQRIDCAVAAHVGWIPVEKGERYTLSCYLKAARPDTPARLFVYQNDAGKAERVVRLTTAWQRYELPFTARSHYVWCAAGPDLSQTPLDHATVWLDAMQFDSGATARPYQPRAHAESQIATAQVGNIFTHPEQGLNVTVTFWNGTATLRQLSGQLTITDFADHQVLAKRVSAKVPAQATKSVALSGLLKNKPGFYRVSWQPDAPRAAFAQSLRCAIVQPYRNADSPFGMNHAYPWNFMLKLCKTAGLTWMRDWSAKWHTVEPHRGQWNFATVDPQIDRVLQCQLNCLMLLPFPSAPWCSTADMAKIRKVLGPDDYRVKRAAVACPASDPALFRSYVDHTVRHYRDRIRWFEVLNEPIYTTYAVPARFGYGLDDYLKILRNAYQTIKQVDPRLTVIGGIGTWPNSHWVQDFITADGLAWCDIMDVHLYPVTIPPEQYEPGLAETWQKMKARGQAKPIWLTEFGCYADDDPWMTPGAIGDSAMSRANWPSERAASAALVKSAAVFLTHGLRKIFFHAGTCGPINGRNGGGIFFEYGGTPRKMYVALNVLANMLGPNPKPRTTFGSRHALRHYVFQTDQSAVAIVWMDEATRKRLNIPSGVTAVDIMGNRIASRTVPLDGTPCYFRAAKWQALATWLQENAATTED